jgi:hypothetical protein
MVLMIVYNVPKISVQILANVIQERYRRDCANQGMNVGAITQGSEPQGKQRNTLV